MAASDPRPAAVIAAAATLYGVPLSAFVAERKRLADDLKRAGDRAAAAVVAKLAKPPVSAWVVNQLYREAADELADLMAAGARMRGGDLSAIGAQRAALARLRARSTELLTSDGHGVTETVLRRVTTTLQALSASGSFAPDAPGELVADRDPPGFEALAPARVTWPPPGLRIVRDEDEVSEDVEAAAEAADEADEADDDEADDDEADADEADADEADDVEESAPSPPAKPLSGAEARRAAGAQRVAEARAAVAAIAAKAAAAGPPPPKPLSAADERRAAGARKAAELRRTSEDKVAAEEAAAARARAVADVARLEKAADRARRLAKERADELDELRAAVASAEAALAEATAGVDRADRALADARQRASE